MQDPTIARGDLFFLWHPATQFTFSGYGLAVAAGRKDLLTGILMVDRPYPLSDVWLESVELTLGDYALYAMTVSHEHGMACQMRVAADSLSYIRPLETPLALDLREALAPLLARPPKPRLVVSWDPNLTLWRSAFDVEDAVRPARTGARPLFPMGQIVATPGALAALAAAGQTPFEFLVRHNAGDWGDLVEEDRRENERALQHGSRLFSAYKLNDGAKIWLITEWDRSVTTILTPMEY